MVFYSKYKYCALSENTNMVKIWAPLGNLIRHADFSFRASISLLFMGCCEFLFDLNFLFLESALPLGPEFPAVSLS